jgi:drug/metabolite transporter (DMT)-like permease
MQKKTWLLDILLLMVAMIWGTTFVLVQDSIAKIPPFSFLAVRFSLAFVIMWLIGRLFFAIPIFTKKNLASGTILGLFLCLGFVLQTFSLLYTTSGNSGFLTGLNVALVPIILFLIDQEKPSLSTTLGVVCAVLGLYFLAFSDLSKVNIGDLLALGCSICFALHIVFTGKLAKDQPIFPLVTIQLGVVAAISFIMALLFEPWQTSFHPQTLIHPIVLLSILICSLLATNLAFFVQTYAQKNISATRVAIIFSTEPVFAALADYIWNGITLTLTGWIGSILILSGMILAELNPNELPWRKSSESKRNEPC